MKRTGIIIIESDKTGGTTSHRIKTEGVWNNAMRRSVANALLQELKLPVRLEEGKHE